MLLADVLQQSVLLEVWTFTGLLLIAQYGSKIVQNCIQECLIKLRNWHMGVYRS